jgi:hypothetical protein
LQTQPELRLHRLLHAVGFRFRLHDKRLENLKTSGRLLAQAEEIRALVERVKGSVLEGQTEITESELASWEEWASGYADRIDPVRSGQVLTHIRVPELD